MPAGCALGSYRLKDTTLYVTLEPCVMCAAAIVHARVRRLVFGAWDPRAGAAGSMLDVFALAGLNHRVDVFGGVLSEECGALLQRFFRERRVSRALQRRCRALHCAAGCRERSAAGAGSQPPLRRAATPTVSGSRCTRSTNCTGSQPRA